MHRTQFDHVRLDLLSLVIWSRLFWPSVTWNLRKAQRWSLEQKRFEVRSLSPPLRNLWLLIVLFIYLFFNETCCVFHVHNFISASWRHWPALQSTFPRHFLTFSKNSFKNVMLAHVRATRRKRRGSFVYFVMLAHVRATRRKRRGSFVYLWLQSINIVHW